MMEHFYQNLLGWFDFEEFYKQIITELPDGAHAVEIGCWKGRSAAFLAVEIINSGKNIKFDCVDPWSDSWQECEENGPVNTSTSAGSLYEQFLENMKPVENYYTPLRMTSIEAAALYKNNSLDFVFIDANHSYKAVKENILAWLPKVKLGGILAGDEYSNQSPGLIKATNELLKPLKISGTTWTYINE